MKIELKLFNFEVVDCSTGFVNIVLDKSTLEVLLSMILKIVESDFIKAIGSFGLQFQGGVGPLIKYQSPYICEEWEYNKKFYASRNIDEQKISKQDSEESKEKKTYGLYVEDLEAAISRRSTDTNVKIVSSGLTGIREALREIFIVLNNDFDNYPSYIPKNLDTIIFLSLGVDIGFVEGQLFMTRLLLDSRRGLISIVFNSDGLPLPDDEYDKPVFVFIGRNLENTLKENWSELFMLDYRWADDDYMYNKEELNLIDGRNKLNPDAFFYNSWYLSDFKRLIMHDNKFDNVIAIYRPLEGLDELWVIVKNLKITPKIDTYGIKILTLDKLDLSKAKKEELLYGSHVK